MCLIALTTKPLHPEARKRLDPLCDELHILPISKFSIGLNVLKCLINGKPFQVGYFFNSKIKLDLSEILDRYQPTVVYGQLVRTAEYIIDAQCYRILDLQDALSKGIERRLNRSFGPMRLILNSEMKRLVRYEQKVIQQFDQCTIISKQDRQELPASLRDKVRIVRNGVDMIHFSPQQAEKSTDILFAGNMGYPPNIIAGQFLAKDVLPLLLSNNLSLQLTLAGATPSPLVRSLGSKNVMITGWVDDMRDCYARAKVFVAPMTIGTGLQNKLLEAMSMGIPCITTELANNPLGAIPNKHLLIARSPIEFSNAITHLLANADEAEELGKAGRRFIQQNYGWEAQTEPLINILKQTDILATQEPAT
ncbi:MAG: glycosyltransferase involved in cell wall biosynthesis [Granulosicoccus sp.]